MKQKIALAFAAFVLATGAFAQNSDSRSEVKGPLIGIHFNALDWKTPAVIANSATPRYYFDLKDMDYGLGVSYWKGLHKLVDFSTKLNVMFHDYASYDRNAPQVDKPAMGIELEPTLNFRPWSDKALLTPFLTAGVGGGYYTGKFGGYVPTGAGVQVNFKSQVYAFLQAAYRWSLTKDVQKSALLYSLGVAQNIGKEKPAPAPVPVVPVVTDRDGDGIADADDKCPDTPGLSALKGCPDRDGDGMADAEDKCPDVAGVARYQGCPIPDTDGDGINDENDKCINVKGVARYQGCPIPDTDGDGVNDEEDKCKDRPGPASNYGCPEIKKEVIEKINYAAKNVYFNTASSKLLAKSYKPLNDVVTILKADETLMLDIDGHTDSQGNDEYNQKLSEDRAKAVKDYLISKGISESRLASTGYGETKPVADNATAAGRAKNRRTEMTVRNY